ncbi:MAG TPA: hypothetical protein DEH78_27855 [Solibacterales bacterium]|nr:hypothetical protein [Bryobacterales bacterium]
MTAVSIVIVSYNSAEVLGTCIASCRRVNPAEIFVVDNASADNSVSVAQRAGAQVIVNTTNKGFAAAANQGIGASSSPAVLLLNPDTELPSSIEPLAAALEDGEVGAAAPVLVDDSGRAQLGFSIRRLPEAKALIFEVLGINRLLPGNPVNARYRCLDLDLTEDQDVEQPAGACLLIRKTAWGLVGGFDEEFHPVWFEDVDFCRRLRRAGFRIRLAAGVAVRHRGGHSVSNLTPGRRQACWYASLLKYAAKAYPGHAVRGIAGALLAGLLPRTITGIVKNRSLAHGSNFVVILRLAGQSLIEGRRGAVDGTGHTGKGTPQYIKSSSGTGS